MPLMEKSIDISLNEISHKLEVASMRASKYKKGIRIKARH